MKHLFSIISIVLILSSCKKENIDLQDTLLTDISEASNRNSKAALPKRIWHAHFHYAYTWDLFYNKKGLIDSIDYVSDSYYYGKSKMGYKVYYSGTRLDSVVNTRYGQVWNVLRNIKYENGLIVQADFYENKIFYTPPRTWRIEYDKKKRPLNSPLGEKFYYNDNGQLIYYTHPYVPGRNASFTSDNKVNPMHQIPDLGIILMNEYETAMACYNPNNITSITYASGEKVDVYNTFDYFGNLIIRSYGAESYWGYHQWNFVY
jgi:hypothetical protein